MYERVERVVVEVIPATSRPHPARSPGLDNPRPGSGQDTSGGPPANHPRSRLGHRRTPWRPRRRRGQDRPGGRGNGGLGRSRMVRQFPPLGVKEMPSYECHPFRGGGVTSKGDMLLTTTTLFSQRAETSPLSFGTLPKRRIRRGTTRISRVRFENAKRGSASRVPPSPGASARRTGGLMVEGATPLF